MAQVDVKWIHASGHAGSVTNAVIDLALSEVPLIVDWSEMYWNTDNLAKFDDYDHFVGQAHRYDSRKRPVGHDVVISTHKDATVLHDREFYVDSEISRFIKYMPERYGKARVIEYKGQRILIIAWHPQPNPFRRILVVLPHYRRSVRRVERVQHQMVARWAPDLVLNGGDLQVGPGLLRPYPNRMAKRLGMHFRRHKIDWQMWAGKRWTLSDFTTIDPSKANKGMDHLWTLLLLTKTTR